MLPLMMLQPTELATFAAEPNSADLLPQDAIEPVVAFAEILQVGLQPPVSAAAGNGSPVPLAGNGLPPIVGSGTPGAGPGAERALPLPAIEPMAIEGRPGRDVLEVRILPAAAEGRTPALPALPGSDSQPRVPLPQTPFPAPVAERLSVDNLQPPLADQQAAASRATPSREQTARELAARPQVLPDTAIQRPGVEAAVAANAATAAADLAQRTHGRTGRPAPVAESLPAGAGNPDARPAPVARDGLWQPGITPEIRQPVPVAAAAQPVQVPVEGLSQGDTPLPQGPNAAQGLQSATVQLSQAPAPLASGAAGNPAAQAPAPIDIPVRDTAWSGMLGERVLVMANNQLQNAEIRLTPAELGPLRVQVAVEDGAANVTFHAQHAITREAIEQALPRLRELFAENGLTLNQADVGEQAGPGVEQGNREAAGDRASSDSMIAEAEADPAADDVAPLDRPRSRPDGLVDTFA